MNDHTQDLTDEFFLGLVSLCADLEVKPIDLLGVMQNESGVQAKAHNKNGDASGLIQFMPFILRNLGWHAGDAAFRGLSAVDQLPYVRKYFLPHKGLLVSAGACYVATFMPACLPHAGDPAFVLCGKEGPYASFYEPNKGFDRAGKGTIIVQDLEDTIQRVCVGARWSEIASRAQDAVLACEAYPDT